MVTFGTQLAQLKRRDILKAFSMPQFQYNALKAGEIRVLILEPCGSNASRSTPLQGKLEPVRLDESPQYEALSYCWGSSATARSLYTPTGTFDITESLYSALGVLRNISGARRVWADAICINQLDKDEKNVQVALMGQIYQRASSCLVYLGPAFSNHTLIPPLLHAMADERFSGAQGQVSRSQKTEVGPPPFHAQAWSAFRELLRSPWFTRKWTVQECVLPRDVVVVCESWSIDWDTFAIAIQKASNRRTPLVTTNDALSTQATQDGANSVDQLRTIRTEFLQGTKVGMLDNLLRFRTRQATEARDHIFALRSISSDGADPAFTPDYQSALSDVTRKTAAAFIRNGQFLKLLYSAGLPVNTSDSDSWIPDWTCARPQLEPFGGLTPPWYQTACRNPPECRYLDEPGFLVVKGGRFDTITHTTSPCSVRREQHSETMGLFERLSPFILEVEGVMKSIFKYPNGEDLRDVQWRTLIANQAGGSYGSPAQLGRVFGALKVLIQHVLSEKNPDVPRPADYSPLTSFAAEMQSHQSQGSGNTGGELLEPFTDTLIRVLQGRKFCRTSKDYVGLVPADTEPGDLIYLVAGSEVPFVIRRSLEKAGGFRLVGEAYIHGIMQGEAREDEEYRLSKLMLH